MIDSSPVHGTVKKGFYSYFTYVYGPGEEDIVIWLTSISGDADIYMTTKPNVKHTTKETSEYVSIIDIKD